jgi:hypothetical protein
VKVVVIGEGAAGRKIIKGAAMDEATSDNDEAAREDDEEAKVGVVIVEEIGSKELSF